MEHPLVSIITPVYNAADVILSTIGSVRSQTYENWEMLLVDDCSTDRSWELLQQAAASDERIKCFQLERNGGAAVARNHAIEKAEGRFIAFLDGDDLWLPDKLKHQVSFSLENKAAITHSDYRLIDAEGARLEKVIHARKELSYQDMLNYNYIGCLTAMYDREVIGEKVLMPEILKRQDYALWLRIMRRGHKAYGLEEVLALYRTGRKSLSSNKLDSAQYNFRLLTEIEGLPKWKAAYHFLRYMMIGVRKYFFS